MIKIEASVSHKKYDYTAIQNTEKYICETLNSKIKDKFTEVDAIIGMSSKNKGELTIVIYIEKGVTSVRLNVIKNNIRKMMKNLSKRYNSNCHIVTQ